MNKKILIVTFLGIAFAGLIVILSKNPNNKLTIPVILNTSLKPVPTIFAHPLSIEEMRKQNYETEPITIEETLANKSGYKQFIASYMSDGNRIQGLLTVPISNDKNEKFPVIIFNHGYIPPEQYRTTEKYVAYVDYFARNGYIVFKSDYRGHGDSEGNPEGAYYSTAYTRDVLHAVNAVKQHPQADDDRIGMWGHSMGGHITLRSMVTTGDIKAGVIWGGVVASYGDMMNNWRRRQPWRPSSSESAARRPTRDELIKEFGSPDSASPFWRSISPIYFVKDISGPVQIHHGLADDVVPWEFSESLSKALEAENKDVEYYTYPGGDHNLSGADFGPAIKRSLEFFDTHVKMPE